MKMIDRIRKFQERSNQQANRNFNSNDEIFFNLSDGTHKVRLVGEWLQIRSHWIAPSSFSRISLYSDNAFKGEHRLRKSVTCPNFDSDTEMEKDEKTCTICKLHAAANDILYNCSDLSSEQKKFLENVARDTRYTDRYFFLCIDRDNPEVSPGKKGYKIIEFPKELMNQWIQLVSSTGDGDCTTVDAGCDFTIVKSRDGNRAKYSIQYVMENRQIVQTPLTDEEKAFEKLDLKKLMGKLPNQKELYEKLLPEFKELVDDASDGSSAPANDAAEDEDASVPF